MPLETARGGSITRAVAIKHLQQGDPFLQLALTTVEC
jgi:hypothetical protein